MLGGADIPDGAVCNCRAPRGARPLWFNCVVAKFLELHLSQGSLEEEGSDQPEGLGAGRTLQS